MSTILIQLGTILTESILMWYFFSNTLRTGKVSSRRELFYYISYGLLLTALLFLPENLIPLRMLLLFLGSLVGNHLVYHPKWLKNIYISVLLYCSIVLTDVFGGGIVSLIGLPVHLNLEGIELLAYHGTVKLLHLILLYFMVNLLNRKRYNVPLQYHALPLILCQIASTYICYQSFFSLVNGERSVAITAEVVCLLFINVILCIYVEKLKETYFLREQNQIAEQKLYAQQTYYRDAIERQEETRSLWHDIKKYLLAMESLAQREKNFDLQEVYQEIHSKFKYLEEIVDVGNPVVNGILSYTAKQAQEECIVLTMDVWVDQDLKVSPSDLYVIIGNTADNAVDACSKLPEEKRKIHMILRQKNHMLFYEVTNPYIKLNIEKPGPFHGYGLKNVEKCVKRNNGEIRIHQDDTLFTVSIRLTV